jgi:DNA-binding MarR family transcriptional regulator
VDHPTQRDYEALAAFRKGLRAFLRFSEDLNAQYGSTQAIYQLMLVIRTQSPHDVDIACAAREMSLRHHSAAELASRAEAAGLVVRRLAPGDRRRRLLELTAEGDRALDALVVRHAAELGRLYRTTFAGLARFAPDISDSEAR